MRPISVRIAAFASLLLAVPAVAADILLPPVPFGATLHAQFALTTTSGQGLSGVPVTITPLNGCGTLAGGGTSMTVVTNGSGTAAFDFVAGNKVGNCRIEGRNGNTVGYAATSVFNPADLAVVEFGSSTPRMKELHTSTTGASFKLWATALDERGSRLPLHQAPVSVQVVPDDNGASAAVRRVGDAVAGPLTDTGTFALLLDTNATAGIYDLLVNVSGVVRPFRIVQTLDMAKPAATKPVAGLPLTMEPLTVSIASGAPATCAITSVSYRAPGAWPSNTPTRGPFLAGLLDIGWANCGLQTIPLRIDFAQDVAAGSTFWTALLGVPATASAMWRPQPTTVAGKSVTVQVNQQDVFGNPFTAAVALPGTAPTSPSRPAVKDLWWSGLQENGWGMSIMQSADRSNLFPVIFAYDDNGAPTWWATGGWWDLAGNVFHLGVVQPRGTAWHAFDPSLLAIGMERGRAELSFTDGEHATFDYRIDGRTGRKTLQRQAFGVPSSASVPDVGGMWWGGSAQAGWGISVAQQEATLFCVWYTYDDRGYPTWVVMPGGTWTSANTYEGRVYRTHSSGWLAQTYDPSKFTVNDVGSYRLRFSGIAATFDYTIDGRAGTIAIARQAPF